MKNNFFKGFGLTDFQNRTTNLANINLIKRYNYYSMRILESMEENTSSEATTINRPENLPSAKKVRLINEEIPDLEKEETASLKGAPLNLVHIDRYFYAPKSSAQKHSAIVQAFQGQDPRSICQTSLNQATNWRINIRPVFIEFIINIRLN